MFDAGELAATLDLDITPFQAKIAQAQKDAAAWVKANDRLVSTLDADPVPFDDQLDEAEVRGEQFADQRFTATLDADTVPAVDAVGTVESRLDQVASKTTEIPVDVNPENALASLQEIQTAYELTAARLEGVTSIGAAGQGATPVPPWASIAQGNLAYDTSVQRWRQTSGSEGGQFATDAQTAAMVAGMSAGAKASMQQNQPDAYAALAGGGTGGGGGGGGLGQGALAAAGGVATFLHVSHLLMPEIIGLGTALGSVAIGFGALGIASMGTARQIYAGYSAVNTAQLAINTAIPGTQAWTTAVGQLGAAWSGIPTALQPAVSSIQKLMAGFANSPMHSEIVGFLGAQAGTIQHMFSGAGSTFAPLILATERALQTIESKIQSMMGSGGLTRLVDAIAKMVGPATVELAQLLYAVMQIGVGFAKAVQAGAGMETLVSIFRTLASIVNTSFFQGFITGWVDFDRLISTALGLLFRLISVFSSATGSAKGLATALGFIVSGLVAVKSGMYVFGLLSGQAGKTAAATAAAANGTERVATAFETAQARLTSFLTKAAGIGLIAYGINGLISQVSQLTGITDPLTSAWNHVASALGLASNGAKSTIDTLQGYTAQLNGPIYVTGQLSNAMDVLVRSEQGIGGTLGGMANGFQNLQVNALGAGQAVSTVEDSVNTLLSNLQQKNQDLTQWAVDAQTLIKRGMDPTAVASLAQQAPQDLASMVTATTGQLQKMNVQWEEQMLTAQMSGQNGVNGFVTALRKGFETGTPVVKQASANLLAQLGFLEHISFTGTSQSITAIGNAINTLPVSVIQTLAGKTHQYSGALLDNATVAKKASASSQSLGSHLLAVATSVAEIGGGFSLLGGGIKGGINLIRTSATALKGWGSSVISTVASAGAAIGRFVLGAIGAFAKLAITSLASLGEMAAGLVGVTFEADILNVALGVGVIGAVVALGFGIYELVKHLGGLRAAFIVAVAGIAALTVAWIALDVSSVGILPLIGLIASALVALGTGIAYLATHWTQSWSEIKHWFDVAVAFLRSGFGTIVVLLSGPIAPMLLLALHWQQVWRDVKNWTMDAVHWLEGLPSTFVRIGENIVSGITRGIVNFATDPVKAIENVGKGILHQITSFFGIFSPSTVMTGVGTNVMAGMTNGITSGSQETIAAATNAAKRIIAAFGSLGKATGDSKDITVIQTMMSHLTSVMKDLGTLTTAGSKVDFGALVGQLGQLGDLAPKLDGVGTALKSAGTHLTHFASNVAPVQKALGSLRTMATDLTTFQTDATKINVTTVTQDLGKLAVLADPLQAVGDRLLWFSGAFKTFAKDMKPVETAVGIMAKLGSQLMTIQNDFAKFNVADVYGALLKLQAAVPILTQMGIQLTSLSLSLENFGQSSKAGVTAINDIASVGAKLVGIQGDFDKLNVVKFYAGLVSLQAVVPILAQMAGQLGTLSFDLLGFAKSIKPADTGLKALASTAGELRTFQQAIASINFAALLTDLNGMDFVLPVIVRQLNAMANSFAHLDTFSTASKHIKDLSGTLSDFGTMVTTLASVTKTTAATNIPEDFTTLVTAAGDLRTGLSKVWSQVQSDATSKWGDITSYVRSVETNVLAPLKSLASQVLGVANQLKAAWASIFTEMKAGWQPIITYTTKLPGQIESPFTSMETGLPKIISTVWSDANARYVSGINTSATDLDRFFSAISAVAGQVGWSFSGHIPLLATGGVFNRATAIVGEGDRHYPEYVLPTDPQYRAGAVALLGGFLTDAKMMASGGTLSTSYAPMAVPSGMTGIVQATANQLGTRTTTALNTHEAAAAKAGGHASPQAVVSFVEQVLNLVGAPITASNVANMSAWANAEGGWMHNSALFNPMNTTMHMPGSSVMAGGSSAGVQSYASLQSGIAATAATLLNGQYAGILAALRASAPFGAFEGAVAGSPWGTSAFASGGVLPVNTFDMGGYLPPGASVAINGTGRPERIPAPGAAPAPSMVLAPMVNVASPSPDAETVAAMVEAGIERAMGGLLAQMGARGG